MDSAADALAQNIQYPPQSVKTNENYHQAHVLEITYLRGVKIN